MLKFARVKRDGMNSSLSRKCIFFTCAFVNSIIIIMIITIKGTESDKLSLSTY